VGVWQILIEEFLNYDLKNLRIEDMILIYKGLTCKTMFWKPSQVYMMEKVQEMAWLPFPCIWCAKIVNKEIKS
jgi:hypothetical protein